MRTRTHACTHVFTAKCVRHRGVACARLRRLADRRGAHVPVTSYTHTHTSLKNHH